MKRIVIFGAILACLLWASAFSVAHIAFAYMPPILLSGVRFILAGLLLLPYLLYKRVDMAGSIRRHWPFMLLFAFVQTFMQYGLFFLGLEKVPAALSAVIIGAGPLFVALMAHVSFADDKLTPRKVFAMLLGMAGVVFIAAQKGFSGDATSALLVGIGLLVASNLVGSYTNIMVVKYNQPLSPILLTSFANFTGGVMLLGVGSVVEQWPTEALPPQFFGALAWLSCISAVGFSVWYTLLQRPDVRVSDLNVWKFIIPVFGAILSWMLLPNEHPDLLTISGMVIITVALQLFQYQRKRRA